ncbi:odorant receptor 131-2-like [Denticeps clupeoides]|uniref:odorant receptor 131-2-like n=1 Tax=Denticeps clupeoides TaxID=299321 RepID=UPI0010A5A185|nr:odorant receptor 131-2-like [Denticeps clupeoides]
MQNDTEYSNMKINRKMFLLMESFVIIQLAVVAIFLYINCLMIFTFLKKEAFRTDTRYILFSQTLFPDSGLILITNLSVVLIYYQVAIHFVVCCLLSVIMSLLSIVSPLALVAMCLERYVAICMPLRHADISTPRTRNMGLLIMWLISSVIPIYVLYVSLFLIPSKFLQTYVMCSIDVLFVESWQNLVRTTLFQMYFLVMFGIVLFTYVKIMKAARAASSENKKSTNKGLRTVLLHAFQLLLSLLQFICPYVESSILHIDMLLYLKVRYSNFMLFILAPRCLSPLIYGLRDEKFSVVLRNYVFFGHYTFVSNLFSSIKSISRVQTKTKPMVI